ncbi:MAG: class I SAM-dependent methyltransferase family protein [Candidatus Micrarchaeota archaeon]|nr:class I SAM-dependent methyltransferase family protein [Candidatus Micrarchaeota archaeon]
MLALKVGKKNGEETRRELVRLGLLNEDFAIGREGDFLLFPLKGVGSQFLEGKEIVDVDLPKRSSCPQSLRDALGGCGLRSFDVVGDIAVIEIPDAMRPREREIGETLLRMHKSIKTVVAKESGVSGEYRVRRVRHIAGEEKTETLHREHGCKFLIDVSKVYFSPRLSHERLRIAQQVGEGENVLVLFGGAAPFAIIIAKMQPSARVYSIELNPDGHKYAVENVRLNKLKNVVPIQGDVREVLKDRRFWGWADRIVMPLPKDALSFLPYVAHTARAGCIVHVYAFCQKGGEDALASEARRLLGRPCEIAYSRRVRTYSPETDQHVLDIRVLE